MNTTQLLSALCLATALAGEGAAAVELTDGWTLALPGGVEVPLAQAQRREWKGANPRQSGQVVEYKREFKRPATTDGDLVLAVGQQRLVESASLNGEPLPIYRKCWMTTFRYGMSPDEAKKFMKGDGSAFSNQDWDAPALFLVPGKLLRENNNLTLRMRDLELAESDPPFGNVELRAPTLSERVAMVSRERERDKVVVVLRNQFPAPAKLSVEWRVEDYFGKELRKAAKSVALGANATLALEVPRESKDDYKVILKATEGDASITDYWAYFPRFDQLAGFRQRLNLDGPGWEFQPVKQCVGLKQAPSVNGWQPADMPFSIYGSSLGGAHRVWLKRKLTIPESFKGRRISLRLEYVSCFATVYVDNFESPAYDGTGDCPEIDITSRVVPGKESTIYLGVTDAVGWFKPELAPVADNEWDAASLRLMSGFVGESIMWAWTWWGVSGSTELRTKPELNVKSAKIRTSVSGKALWTQVTLRNDGAVAQEVEVRQQVLHKGRKTLGVEPRKVVVPAAGEATVTTETPWSSPLLWTPYTPELYQLRTELATASGNTLDVLDSRFGFREFAIAGDHFTLNGAPFHPYGASGYTDGVDAVKFMKSKHETYSREWFGKTTEAKIDLFDEVGLAICMESTQDCASDFRDPRTFANWESWMKRVIDAYQNHPSVMFWNAGNEIIPIGKPMDKLSGVGAMMRRLKDYDPTRIMMSEGSGDIGGLAETYAPHYPDARVLPDDYLWLGRKLAEIPKSQIARRKATWSDSPEFVYKPNGTEPAGWPRTKPLFTGEFTYQPEAAIGYGAPWIGEEAYCPGPLVDDIFPLASHKAMDSLKRAKFATLRMIGLSGFCSHMRQHVGSDYLNPVAAFAKEFSANLFAGEKVKRTIFLFNDLSERRDMKFSWKLTLDGEEFAQGARKSVLAPGTSEAFSIEFNAPDVKERSYAYLNLHVDAGGGRAFDDTKRLTVFPRFMLDAGALKVAVYDPPGASAKALEQAGLKFSAINRVDKDALAGVGLLVVGDGAADDQIEKASKDIKDYVEAGGHVLALRQETARPWVPVRNLGIGDASGSVAVVTAQGHPVLKNLLQEDFRYWRNQDGSLVYSLAMHMPNEGGFRALVRGGRANGDGDCNQLEDLCLLEVPAKRGWYLCSQLELTPETLQQEPAARTLFQNIVDYAKIPNATKPVALLTPGGELQEYMEAELGVVFANKASDLRRMGDLKAFGAITASDWKSADDLAAASSGLKEYVANGGTFVLHGLDHGTLLFLDKVFGLKLTLTEFPCPRAVKVAADPLLWGISNADLAWKLSDHDQGYLGRQPQKGDIVRAVPTGEALRPLCYPALLSKIAFGSGSIVIDQGRWLDRPQRETILSTFHVNLGTEVKPKGVLDSDKGKLLLDYDLFPVDLAKFCNRGFKDEGVPCTDAPVKNEPGKKRGWSAQGPDCDLREFPTDKNTLAGIPFWIANPDNNDGGGCVALWNQHDGSLPEAITGIPVGRKADSLYFLHASCWNAGGGLPGWKYIVRYKGFKNLIIGQDPSDWTQVFAVRQGLEVGEWAKPGTLPNAVVAWQGRCRNGWSCCVYMTEWKNPYPNREIESLELVSEKNSLYPLIIAVTGAAKKGAAK